MGYESKLFVVEKTAREYKNFNGDMVKAISDFYNNKEMYYSRFIACFDLSKCYDISDVAIRYPKTDNYCFCCDHNEPILHDMYDEELTEIPLKDMIDIIENAMSKDSYRRYAPCLAMLKALYEDRNNWNEVVVLHYGY